MSLGQVALDGTKVKANVSKYKAMSQEPMLKSEQQLEDGKYGKGKPGDELPVAQRASAKR